LSAPGDGDAALIRPGAGEFAGRTWNLIDQLSGATYERSADDLRSSGLYVNLAAWGCYFFHCIGNTKEEPAPYGHSCLHQGGGEAG
jgi:hypothetical protein